MATAIPLRRAASPSELTHRLRDPGAGQQVFEGGNGDQRLRQLEALILGAHDAIIVTDVGDLDEPYPRIVYVNSGFERLTGYAAQNVIGHSPRILQGPGTDRECLDQMRQALHERSKIRTEILNYSKEGREYWVEMDINPIFDEHGECTQFIAIGRDVTDRKLLEEELLKAKEKAEAANVAKSQFLLTMSHELRTPLNAIIGFSELMSREIIGPLGNPTYHEYSENIHASGRDLLRLIEDMLDVATLETGGITLDETWIDPAALVQDAVRTIAPAAQAKRIHVVSRTEPGLPRLRGDYSRLRQVLLNLLSNAVKFSLEEGRVEVTAEAVHDVPVLGVSDDGPGIPPQDCERMLRPFEHNQPSLTKSAAGIGMGLYLARALVLAHGGELMLDSEIGKGTKVRIFLPPSRRER